MTDRRAPVVGVRQFSCGDQMVDIAFGPEPGRRPNMADSREAYLEMVRRKRMYGGVLMVWDRMIRSHAVFFAPVYCIPISFAISTRVLAVVVLNAKTALSYCTAGAGVGCSSLPPPIISSPASMNSLTSEVSFVAASAIAASSSFMLTCATMIRSPSAPHWMELSAEATLSPLLFVIE